MTAAAKPSGTHASVPVSEFGLIAPDTTGMNFYRCDTALQDLLRLHLPDNLFRHIAPHLDRHPGLDGLFVVWDEPAVASLAVIESRPRRPVMTTVDLGA